MSLNGTMTCKGVIRNEVRKLLRRGVLLILLLSLQHYTVLLCYRKIQESEPKFSKEVRVFSKLILLYGLTRLQTHIGDLYEGGLTEGPALSRAIKTSVLSLCTELLPEAVSLVDVIAPPDFILNSAIGKADGEVIMGTITGPHGVLCFSQFVLYFVFDKAVMLGPGALSYTLNC